MKRVHTIFKDHSEEFPILHFVSEDMIHYFKMYPSLLVVDSSKRPKNIKEEDWIKEGEIYTNYILNVPSLVNRDPSRLPIYTIQLVSKGNPNNTFNKLLEDPNLDLYKFDIDRFLPIFASLN